MAVNASIIFFKINLHCCKDDFFFLLFRLKEMILELSPRIPVHKQEMKVFNNLQIIKNRRICLDIYYNQQQQSHGVKKMFEKHSTIILFTILYLLN